MKLNLLSSTFLASPSAVVPTWLVNSAPGSAGCALTLEQVEALSQAPRIGQISSCYEAIQVLDAKSSSSPSNYESSVVEVDVTSISTSSPRLPPKASQRFDNGSSSHIPSNWTGTFNPDNWAVSQGALSIEKEDETLLWSTTSSASPFPGATWLSTPVSACEATTMATMTSTAEGESTASQSLSIQDLSHEQQAGSWGIVPEAGIERINRCSGPLYYFPVWEGHVPSYDNPSRKLDPGSMHFEPYHLAEGEYGVSEKYAHTYFEDLPGEVPILQLEYTTSPDLPDRVDADVSLIDCPGENCPAFSKSFILMFPNTNCPYAHCEGQYKDNSCTEAYGNPDDDFKAMRTCKYDGTSFYNDVNMTMIFCPNAEDIAKVPSRR